MHRRTFFGTILGWLAACWGVKAKTARKTMLAPRHTLQQIIERLREDFDLGPFSVFSRDDADFEFLRFGADQWLFIDYRKPLRIVEFGEPGTPRLANSDWTLPKVRTHQFDIWMGRRTYDDLKRLLERDA